MDLFIPSYPTQSVHVQLDGFMNVVSVHVLGLIKQPSLRGRHIMSRAPSQGVWFPAHTLCLSFYENIFKTEQVYFDYPLAVSNF